MMKTFIVELRRHTPGVIGPECTIIVIDATSKAEAKRKAESYMKNVGWAFLHRTDPDYTLPENGMLASEWYTTQRFCDRI